MRAFGVLAAILTAALLALGAINSGRSGFSTNTPDGAVQALFSVVRSGALDDAYQSLANKSALKKDDFVGDIRGRNGSLRTYSSLQNVKTHVLKESESEALVRADLQWSTAVGANYDTRDIKLVKDGGKWRAVWAAEQEPKVPPQVIPVNFLRWDVVTRGSNDDWGAQNVDAPRVRIVSMNAVERDGGVIILGEIVNEDTVPGFVTVNATLVGKDGNVLAEESSFDKMSHTLLPKEVSPFRIDFPGRKVADVKSVRMQPNSLLVPASADPVIGVLHQRTEKDASDHDVLKGELMNQSGQTVNIPHVMATYYDSNGRVIWVSDGYVDKALLPQTPVPFQVALRSDIMPQVHSYRVTVNQYSIDRQ